MTGVQGPGRALRATGCRRGPILLLGSLLLVACVSSPPEPATREVVVADFGDRSSTAMTREQLQEEVMRFADRFSTQLTQVAEQIRYSEGRDENRVDLVLFQHDVNAGPLEVAVGPNAVTNLLDMMVMASLAHDTAQRYWQHDIRHPDDIAALLRATERLERDIWLVSEDVLTDSQRDSLRDLIKAWRREHPDIRQIFGIRFGAFSGQKAADLEQVQRSGGLTGQFARSVDNIEALRGYGERLLFYLQRAPELARLQSELAVYEVLGQPEFQTLVADVDRLTLVGERAVGDLSREREAAIRQLLEGVAAERDALLEEVLGDEGRLRAAVEDFAGLATLIEQISANVRETTAALERVAVTTNLDLTPSGEPAKPIDLTEIAALLEHSNHALLQTRQLIASVEDLAGSGSLNAGLPIAFRAVDSELDELVNRVFVYALALIAVFFAGLFGYRAAVRRYLPERS